MPKKMWSFILLAGGLVWLTGCASSNLEVRAYTQDKPRVDQEMYGNAGYLLGKPKHEPPVKSTRKVYVVEVSSPQEIPPGLKKEERAYDKDIDPALLNPPPVKRTTKVEEVYREVEVRIPPLDAVEPEPPKEADPTEIQPDDFRPNDFVQYTVEKGDTLQKISKKFYDSFSKWPRIYKANKDLIKNPDRIEPGITLRIPVQK